MRTHGRISTYIHGCRCDECREASRRKRRAQRERVRGNPPEHGTLNAYTNYACRCEECRAVARERYLANLEPSA